MASMPTPRYGCGAVHIPNVGELVLGGCDRCVDSAPNLRTAEILLDGEGENDSDRIWQQLTPMIKPRIWPAVAHTNGNVYVARDDENTVELLTLSTGQWSIITTYTDARTFIYSMEVYAGRILIASELNKLCKLLIENTIQSRIPLLGIFGQFRLISSITTNPQHSTNFKLLTVMVIFCTQNVKLSTKKFKFSVLKMVLTPLEFQWSSLMHKLPITLMR